MPPVSEMALARASPVCHGDSSDHDAEDGDEYRVVDREDGRKWSGIELERATGDVVTRSYVSNLRKGRIENPGYEKMMAIATAVVITVEPPHGSRNARRMLARLLP